jgi:hypothetical protein
MGLAILWWLSGHLSASFEQFRWHARNQEIFPPWRSLA